MAYAPLAGLLLASPVVLRALTGEAGVEDALAAWLVGMAVAAVGLWLLGQCLRPGPQTARTAGEDGRDSPGRAGASPGRRKGDTPTR